VIICFVDIDGLIDHHCLNFLFIMIDSKSFLLNSQKSQKVHKGIIVTELLQESQAITNSLWNTMEYHHCVQSVADN
jgi:hypothetical protein